MTEEYYAHSLEGKPNREWQPLDEHLKNVAEMACSFAEAFGAGDWGCLAGLWHDIGKYSAEFQDMLSAAEDNDAHIETKPGRVDHSTAGAQHASKLLGNKGKLLAYAIAGHHAGLPDGTKGPKKETPLFRGVGPTILSLGGLCLNKQVIEKGP